MGPAKGGDASCRFLVVKNTLNISNNLRPKGSPNARLGHSKVVAPHPQKKTCWQICIYMYTYVVYIYVYTCICREMFMCEYTCSYVMANLNTFPKPLQLPSQTYPPRKQPKYLSSQSTGVLNDRRWRSHPACQIRPWYIIRNEVPKFVDCPVLSLRFSCSFVLHCFVCLAFPSTH